MQSVKLVSFENHDNRQFSDMKDADRLEKRRAQERKVEFTEILLNFFKKEYISKLDTKEVESGKKDPYMAAQEVLKKLGVM